jgi:hypothetical protein
MAARPSAISVSAAVSVDLTLKGPGSDALRCCVIAFRGLKPVSRPFAGLGGLVGVLTRVRLGLR